MANLAVAVPSAMAEYKAKRDGLQDKINALDELIQRLEANPELLRTMELVKHIGSDDRY